MPPTYLEYDYRWPLLQRELSDFGAEILCLQEVTHERCGRLSDSVLYWAECGGARPAPHSARFMPLWLPRRWEELRSFMAQLGYDSVVQHKPHDMLLAVFWSSSRFSLRWSEERSRAMMVELEVLSAKREPSEHERQLWEVEERQEGGGQAPRGDASRQNGCTSAANTDGAGVHSERQRRLLYVINVHLEASPHRPGDRVNQIRHALHRLQYHLHTRGIAPEAVDLVVAGRWPFPAFLL